MDIIEFSDVTAHYLFTSGKERFMVGLLFFALFIFSKDAMWITWNWHIIIE